MQRTLSDTGLTVAEARRWFERRVRWERRLAELEHRPRPATGARLRASTVTRPATSRRSA